MRRLRKAELVERLGVSAPGSKRRGPSRGRSESRNPSRGRVLETSGDEEEETKERTRALAPKPKPKPKAAPARQAGRAGSVDVIVTVARAQRLKTGSAQPARQKQPADRPPSNPRARKPPKAEKPFKRGVYNHTVVFNPTCEQYESKKPEPNTECCPDCTAKEFVRAAKTDNITLFKNMAVEWMRPLRPAFPRVPAPPTTP
jgi:hypothetical protein